MPRLEHPIRDAAVAVLLALSAAGCSADDGLDAAQQAEAETLIDQLATTGMIDLSAKDLTCAADTLTVVDLESLRAGSSGLESAAEAVVECVGEDVIGASVLQSQAGSVSAASLACAADELDRRFIVDLVAGLMAEAPPQVQAEIEVARALGLCLELDELLRQ